MVDKLEGFYAAYFTGSLGSSLAVFCFKGGALAGADVGGGKYNGTYTLAPDGNAANCVVTFVLQVGQQSITGQRSEQSNNAIKVPVALSLPIDPKVVTRIDTAIGPINARFEKINSF
jgi:hypothetical protein